MTGKKSIASHPLLLKTMVHLAILSIMIIGTFAGPNKERKYKGRDPGNPYKRNKIFNWDFTILGHRGGASGFIPEHSIMSYTIGAQHGADYLEPDIVFTSDAIQINQHHPDLSAATNVDKVYGKNSDKYTPDGNITLYWRTIDEGGPGPHPYPQTAGGYFSFDFTYQEIQTLSLISDDLTPSPFDRLNLSITTFDQVMELIINELSPVLKRPIGVIPELKYHHEFTKRLGQDVELLHLETLVCDNYVHNNYWIDF